MHSRDLFQKSTAQQCFARISTQPTIPRAADALEGLAFKEGISWSPWVYSLEQQEWAKEKNKALPEVELGVLYFSPKWSQKDGSKLVFPIVVKRTLNKERYEEIRRKNSQLRLVADDGYLKDDPYDYYGVLTNFPLDVAKDKDSGSEGLYRRYSLQEVIEHHQKRGNMENFVREESDL